AGGGGEDHVGGDGGDDDEVELGRVDVAPAQEVARGGGRDVARGGARLHHVPRMDPGARADPLVVRVDELLQVGVGQDALGDVASQRADAGPSLVHAVRPPVAGLAGPAATRY